MSFLGKTINCPNCQKPLEKQPAKKTKCPQCDKPIYVRHGKLLTEEEKIKHDDLEMFRFAEQEYEIRQLDLSKKWGSAPSHKDIIWGLANDRIAKLTKKSDLMTLRDLYLAMARLLHREGKDFIGQFKESRKCDLLEYNEYGTKKVKIDICREAAPSCLIYSDKILPIREALNTLPIPNKDCLNKNRKEFHVCGYDPAPYDFK